MSALLDRKACERAYLTRDARFDGRFFVGVRTTGVFCRPVCRVRSPRPENVDFYPDAAAAADAGFRPCLRCRPELAPGHPHWPWQPPLVQAALGLIDADLGLGAGEVARRLGVSGRHLRRLFDAHLGTQPGAVIRSRRLLFAKRLVTDSSLPMTRIAQAAGYGSQRRFNAAFTQVYGRAPSSLRKQQPGAPESAVRLNLPYRSPFDWPGLSDFFARRAIPGVEQVTATGYARSFEAFGQSGMIELRHRPSAGALELSVHHPDARALHSAARQCRQLFDLDALPDEIASRLEPDPRLATVLARSPGLRVPGAWNLFELCVRAVLGQQITVAAASTLASRLVDRFGSAMDSPIRGIDRLFPAPQALIDAPVEDIGLPRARARTLRTLAAAFATGQIGQDDPQACCAALEAIPGIGPWTVSYVRLRALRDPDSLPSGDIVLRRVLSDDGTPLSPAELERLSTPWRPWRSYAVLALWRLSTLLKENRDGIPAD